MFRRRRRTRTLRIYFTSDIHGSELCFRKFLSAATSYEADVLVLGGDLTGKAIVPIVAATDGAYHASFQGSDMTLYEHAELDAFERTVRYNGLYPFRTTCEEQARLTDDAAAQRELFEELMRIQIRNWVQLAADRLDGTDVICTMMLGNDDYPALAQDIETNDRVINPEGRVVALPGGFTMISSGWSNITPWHSPRELPEDELADQIEQFVGQAATRIKLIFNLHCPPYSSGLDTVQQLDAHFRPVFEGGNPVLIPAGSTAVRAKIEQYQPVVSLHGHIHETRGAQRIGRTLAINPGSDYASGQLHGVIVDLDDEGVIEYLLSRG